jgi:hypothetical protein
MDTDETLSFSIRNRLHQTVRSLRKGFLRELRPAFLSVSIRVHPWSKNISFESFRLRPVFSEVRKPKLELRTRTQLVRFSGSKFFGFRTSDYVAWGVRCWGPFGDS